MSIDNSGMFRELLENLGLDSLVFVGGSGGRIWTVGFEIELLLAFEAGLITFGSVDDVEEWNELIDGFKWIADLLKSDFVSLLEVYVTLLRWLLAIAGRQLDWDELFLLVSLSCS